MDYINWFFNVEPALHTWDKSYLFIWSNNNWEFSKISVWCQTTDPNNTAPVGGLLLLVFIPSKIWFLLFTFLSSFQGSGLPWDLNSLMDLRRVVDFAHLFSCCEDEDDNFRALYMSDQKPLLLSKRQFRNMLKDVKYESHMKLLFSVVASI